MRLGVPSEDVCQVEPTYEYKGKRYSMNHENKELKVGTILYDSVREDFFELESIEDLEKYAYMAPELYGVLEEVKL